MSNFPTPKLLLGDSTTSRSDMPSKTEDIENKEEDQDLKQKEKKTKARLRTRGPYRKAHADW
jgi:hypothetical protein